MILYLYQQGIFTWRTSQCMFHKRISITFSGIGTTHFITQKTNLVPRVGVTRHLYSISNWHGCSCTAVNVCIYLTKRLRCEETWSWWDQDITLDNGYVQITKKSLGILYQPYDANWTILDYFIIHTAWRPISENPSLPLPKTWRRPTWWSKGEQQRLQGWADH